MGYVISFYRYVFRVAFVIYVCISLSVSFLALVMCFVISLVICVFRSLYICFVFLSFIYSSMHQLLPYVVLSLFSFFLCIFL